MDILQRVKHSAPLRPWRARRHRAWFLSEQGYLAHCGVFESFEQARAWLPKTREFDQRELTDEYVEVRTQRVFAYDYPVLFWLAKAFEQGARRVWDIGGSVGVHYFAYRTYVEYPDGVEWLVSELPNVVEVGRELALREGAAGLSFSSALDPGAIEADVWISAGAMQFIETALQGNSLLARARYFPQHLLFNKLPLYEGDDFVATQNIGRRSFTPVHVYNRQRFVACIEELGYQLLDAWDVPERSFHLMGRPDKSFDHFSGLYFRARSSNFHPRTMR